MNTSMRYGYRIVGNALQRRRLIDSGSALAAYARCDDAANVNAESYLSAFDYGDDFRQHMEQHQTPKGFDGVCYSRWLVFDIDREGDLETALADARRLAAWVFDTSFTLPEVFFSGSKGAHILLSMALWLPEPSVRFNLYCRAMAEQIAAELGFKTDAKVFTKTQPLRSPNSRHPKTGLHKRHLTFDQLMTLDVDAICALAMQPAPFAWQPTPTTTCSSLVARWQAAIKAVDEAVIVRHRDESRTALNRLTLEFIREGADHGERHGRLFSAAANLAEFGCSLELATALLTEAALDTGLPPSEVKRQIRCGLAHRRPQNEQ